MAFCANDKVMFDISRNMCCDDDAYSLQLVLTLTAFTSLVEADLSDSDALTFASLIPFLKAHPNLTSLQLR
jgi:hypothetical protein